MYIYLDIVEKFSCQMCGTCCRNDWQVTVDQASYERNYALFARQGRLDEFRQAFSTLTGKAKPGEYAAIAKQTTGGACWFLADSNFCRLHREAGHQHLDAVCQTFPRYPMTSARGIELTLSFSCPAVLDQIARIEPMRLVKNEIPPLPLIPDQYTEQVFPKQKRKSDPLRYYFELEQHFIDIIQCRRLPFEQRISLLDQTVQQLGPCADHEDAGSQLNQLFWRNYDKMEAGLENAQPELSAEILIEHFLVNFIFKKPFYTYGLQQAFHWLELFWRTIMSGIDKSNTQAQWDSAKKIIMELEVHYGHNRSALGLVDRYCKK
ncbi:flagellar biosynthetic protein FliU [Sporomusaceae bacterium FL31]|nr:flagellar biosynthetic protein FliU [Sporomusaceae bacterium FL31]GCE34668.1 flagellar biosynthetic protein FliU [Sporomusaceae bacterium]